MRTRFWRFPLGCLLASFSFFTGTNSWSCGLSWTPPQNHYDGVNEQGNLSYWKEIGEVDLGKGLKLPLIIGFNSSRNSSSPYLGDGWILALLESSFVQIDDKRFLMVQPDGWISRFGRAKTTDTTLEGQGGWMAELGDNTVTVWARCGWKLIFTNGKITSITTPTGHELSYIYRAGVVSEMDDNGTPVLRVLCDPSSGSVTGVSYNGNTISFQEAPKPRVENIAGTNVVGEVKQSLSKLSLLDGSMSTYSFAVDSHLQPTLTVLGKAESRSFTWDPITRLILRDGDWRYSIVPGSKPFDNAKIERENNAGQKEFWFYDGHDGLETSQGLNGVRSVTQRFTSGILKGKVRSYKQTLQERVLFASSSSYDETGRLIRMVQGSDTIEFKYDDARRPTKLLKNGTPIATRQYDQQGRMIDEEYIGIHSLIFKYDQNGSEKKIFKGSDDAAIKVATQDGIAFPKENTVDNSAQDSSLSTATLPIIPINIQRRKEGMAALQQAGNEMMQRHDGVRDYNGAYGSYMKILKDFGSEDPLLAAEALYGATSCRSQMGDGDLSTAMSSIRDVLARDPASVPYSDRAPLVAIQSNFLNLWFASADTGNLVEDIKAWKAIADQVNPQHAALTHKILVQHITRALEEELNEMFVTS